MQHTNEINIRYINQAPEMPKLQHIGGKHKSNWIDLYVSDVKINGEYAPVKEDADGTCYVEYDAGDYLQLYFGIAMALPPNKEAHVAPRGSTFKNYGLIQTNSVGVVDSSYSGNDDEWFAPMYALRSGRINMFDRTNQFRIMDVMQDVEFVEKDFLPGPNRGGHGSTGR